jgi:hypothetical protein
MKVIGKKPARHPPPGELAGHSSPLLPRVPANMPQRNCFVPKKTDLKTARFCISANRPIIAIEF